MIGGEEKVRRRIREILRFAAVIVPLTFVVYGWFIDLYRFNHSNYLLPAIMIPWLLVSMLSFVSPAKRQNDILLRLGFYHLCASAFTLLISSFLVPFVALGWILLVLASYIHLSNKGLFLSLAVVFTVIVADIFRSFGNHEFLLAEISSVLSTLIIGGIIILIIRTQQADGDELLRSRALESLQSGRMNTLINNLADAVININEEGRVELYNAASLNLLNTNIGLHQQLIDDVIKVHDQSGKAIKLFQMARKAKGVMIRDDLSLDSDGEAVRLEITASPVRSSYSRSKGESSADGYILILRDITKAKSLEEERDEFISVVSHELRTPITIVEGTLSNIQLMIEKGKTPPGTLERSLADAHDQILFLSRMVNDLSTLSRAERGVADAAEEIDVKAMVESLYKEYSPQAEKKQLHFDIDVNGNPGKVTASHLYLRELLQNLITNAIKYTKEGSVTLKVVSDEGQIKFEVIDTGIGISKSDQAKIFKKFYRSEDYRTRETGGTGLGLYVASKLSKKLGTAIAIKSRLNHGSSFSFSMPVDN